MAEDLDNPADFDRGVAPFQLMARLKAAHDALGPHSSLDGVLVGTRAADPALKAVRHPHDAQFVIYSVPDDIAVAYDCESRMTVGGAKPARRAYGTYSGVTFNVVDRHDYPVKLLWARDNGYWKIVSWEVGANVPITTTTDAPPGPEIVRGRADPTLVDAARGFLTSWLVQKDADAAFTYLSPDSYACYDLNRAPDAAASTSPADAGVRLREALASSSQRLGVIRDLGAVLSSIEPAHPAIRVLDHPDEHVFSLSSVPDALADAFECGAQANGAVPPDPMPLNYGQGFGMTTRFVTKGGDTPVLRLLWRKESGAWRITAYDIVTP
jgi:hypothetical protein